MFCLGTKSRHEGVLTRNAAQRSEVVSPDHSARRALRAPAGEGVSLLEREPGPRDASDVSCVPFTSPQAGIWRAQVTVTSAGRHNPRKQRGSSELGTESAAFSRRTPRAFQLGFFHSKGLCYKAVWEKEGINAPEAAVKSTLQSSCSHCYLILILIEVFSCFARGT